MTEAAAAFIEASFWHGSRERCESILSTNPDVASSDVYTAAILGDDGAVRRFLAQDAANATAKGGPRDVDALTYLCFSCYLLDPARSDGFLRSATALLDAGASANTGFHDPTHKPEPEWESVLYGSAGVAHHAGLTRLLIERGADPNDNEVPYHSPETYDNAALRVLVESGRLDDDSVTTMLLRKADWHDREGITYLLEHGANPNRMTVWHVTALHQAVRRDNAREIVELMLENGADPTLENDLDKRSSVVMAARRGRRDLLELFASRGISITLDGVDRLIAGCALNDTVAIHDIASKDPKLVSELLAMGGTVLAEFAGNGNTDGVLRLLGLGVDSATLYEEGNGYFGIAPRSTSLHVAAWLARHATVRALLDHRAPVNALDGNGRTALALAVRACVDTYWTGRRSPESVQALLNAGASVQDVKYPSGYDAVDELLRRHGAR